MQITRRSIDTMNGPADWFTGDVHIDTIAAGSTPSRLGAANVHFTPGARTAWHTHPVGQTIYVVEGVGLCQREGGPVDIIRPGDRVFFEPGENHWHGAAPNRFMVHTAMHEADDSGSPVTWGEHVTDEQYNATPTARRRTRWRRSQRRPHRPITLSTADLLLNRGRHCCSGHWGTLHQAAARRRTQERPPSGPTGR